MKSLAVCLLFYSYQTDKRSIELCLSMDKVLLGVDKAILCGLIINELISNCIKYAFPEGSRCKIEISLGLVGDRDLFGGEGWQSREARGSGDRCRQVHGTQAGLTMIKQLKGRTSLDSTSRTKETSGTRIEIRFIK